MRQLRLGQACQDYPLEFCENGAKATAWEVTNRRADAEFFTAHTLTELEAWRDHDLGEQGRLTQPMRWNAQTDKYEPVKWEEERLIPDQSEFAPQVNFDLWSGKSLCKQASATASENGQMAFALLLFRAQVNYNHCPSPRSVCELHASAMRNRDRLNHRQSQPCTTGCPRP